MREELEESDLIIFMLSANFFSSKYILENEVKRGMDMILENPSKKVLCVIVSTFVDLASLGSATDGRDLSPTQDAVLQLASHQYLPYGNEINQVTHQTHEKIIPLDLHPNLPSSLAQIVKKVIDSFKQ